MPEGLTPQQLATAQEMYAMLEQKLAPGLFGEGPVDWPTVGVLMFTVHELLGVQTTPRDHMTTEQINVLPVLVQRFKEMTGRG